MLQYLKPEPERIQKASVNHTGTNFRGRETYSATNAAGPGPKLA